MSAPPPIVQKLARRYKLDPWAVWAVASPESGYRRYAVGDNGTSFGWWQLHQGGALPGGLANPSQWAGSRAGIDYALRKMAESGAAGLTGRRAIKTIVRNFERPADPSGEIARALAAYGGAPAAGGGMAGPASTSSAGPAAPDRRQLAMALLQGIQQNQSPAELVSIFSQNGGAQLPLKPTSPAPGGASSFQGGGVGGKVAKIAARQLGEPYVWGGESRKEGGFDCSGLVQWAYGQMGVKLPRTAAEQMRVGRAVSFNRLRPGDLIAKRDGSHIVMYVGGGKVIAAPRRGTVVHFQPVGLFRSGYVARRVL